MVSYLRNVFQVKYSICHVRVNRMSGCWVRDCKRILEQMKKFEDTEGRDRLDRRERLGLFYIRFNVAYQARWMD